MTDSARDKEILDILRKGLRQSDPVPSTVSEFAAALFTWRDIDAELAELTFDSVDEQTPTGVRSTSTARMISFEVGKWTIDLEYNPATRILLGSISPKSPFTVELHSRGARFAMELDDMGRFEFDDVEGGPASLVFRSSDGEVVKTSWIVL
ncbi:MAG: hypothetical protein ACFCU2_05930 [Acidimicrobiia bacterium]